MTLGECATPGFFGLARLRIRPEVEGSAGSKAISSELPDTSKLYDSQDLESFRLIMGK